jgi:four helix bundle protein
MARDHRQLRVFQEAHQLVLAIYRETRNFPRDEWFGTRAQMRRAAVSVTTNIVEGSARRGTAEYVNFINVARGSASEVSYLVLLASELGYLSPKASQLLGSKCENLIPQLESLIQKLAAMVKTEKGRRE